VIVKGQCTLDMQNKVESLKSHNLIEENDDVISKQKAGQRAITTKDLHHVLMWENPNGGPQCQWQQQ
jgi:hypothetical protein